MRGPASGLRISFAIAGNEIGTSGAHFVRSTLECAWQGHRFGRAVES
jgi:hypothetical protein